MPSIHPQPGSSAANVFLWVSPGQSFKYSFTQLADHPAGLFQYHTHLYGRPLALSARLAGARPQYLNA